MEGEREREREVVRERERPAETSVETLNPGSATLTYRKHPRFAFERPRYRGWSKR